MDILDIDEALKDDSFICLEDKTHDDVSNILQQWKSNNCQLPAQYQQQEQAYKLNSRTFTRPRRKPAQNLEQHFAHTTGNNGPQTPHHHTATAQSEQHQHHKFTIATPQPMFNLEIGGLVTTMHKSFLQDTSPPSSICSSMEVSMERMNNSLITSADFTNINFLQSTQSLDFNDPTAMLNGTGDMFNLANKATSDGYTLSDMIRDRKALESLTLSGDGTLIKDSQIGQIDDISLALSKTASGYSTMDNSTESMQDEQQQQRNDAMNITTVAGMGSSGGVDTENKCNIMHRTMLLSDDVISDTTFDLVESSLCESSDNGIDIAATTPVVVPNPGNETFKKPWPMDETVCLPTSKPNATFEFQQSTQDTRLAIDEPRCETPENLPEIKGTRKFYESTPHTAAGLRTGAQNHTPTTTKLNADEVNLSPIVGSVEQLNATRVLSDTFNQEMGVKRVNSKTFSGTLPRLESIEQMLEDIENPNETYEKAQELQQSAADIQNEQNMQNVLELAHAEEELLASNNDQEFEHMLEEFSKVEVNAEHMKMKKSLETIKRRFNRDTITLTKAPTSQQINHDDNELQGGDLHEQTVEMNLTNASAERRNGSYMKADINASNESKRSLINDCSAPSGMSTPSPSSITASSASTSSLTASNGGPSNERLLSRRSRLYDNINLSTISTSTNNNNNHHHSPSRTLGASFTIQKRNENEQAKHETDCKNEQEEEENNLGKTDEEGCENTPPNNYSGIGTYKLSERRERDRDRFKTIKIVKGRNASDGLVAVNVPCIDDDDDTTTGVAETGAGDAGNPAVFNNNKSEIEMEKDAVQVNDGESSTARPSALATSSAPAASKINPNFLTYKKPKDKQTNVDNLPEIASAPLPSSEEMKAPSEPPPSRLRSRSRPRYISGLQKMTVVKATSAGDLDRAAAVLAARPSNISSNSHAALDDSHVEGNVSIASAGVTTNLNRTTQPIIRKTTEEQVKSPMGTKSKSFHNLSSNFGFNGSGSGLPTPRTNSLGLRKPTALESNVQRTGNGPSSNVPTQQGGELIDIGTIFRHPCQIYFADKPFSLKMAQRRNQFVCKPNWTTHDDINHSDDAVFKVPKLISGLRAPGVKRAGLVRPSSGYYSLNSLAAKGMPPLPQAPLANDTDSDGGRHSPTDSMSSASSRGSLHSGSGGGGSGKPITAPLSKPANPNTTLNLTKITTGSTGIPKPSGLRPPTTALKRSGLPKPGTVMARR